MMPLFSSSFPVLFVLFAVSKTFAMTSCPDTVKVEAGTNSTISCIVDEATNDFYWYKGKSSDKDLVGKLENGIKSMSEQHMDAYDISPSGALLIPKAGIVHESLYSLVTFDSNRTPEEDEVIINITITPDPSCPIINNCTPCEKCELLQTNSSGTLTCKVGGSRPRVMLSWITTSQTGVSFRTYPPIFQPGNVSPDTWDTSVSLYYEFIGLCSDTIVLQCVAEDDLDILQSKVSIIEIRTAQCNTVTSANSPLDGTLKSSESFPVVLVIIVVMAVVILVVIGVLCVIFKMSQKKNSGYGGIPLSESQAKEELVKKLVHSLKARYEEFCYLTPLPWVEDIHIADFYTEGQCTVTDKTGSSDMSTKDLRTTRDILTERWVIFKAEHGYGRTTFLKHVVQEWIKDEDSNRLLIYIPLKQVKENAKISDIVIGKRAKASRFKAKDIEAILKTMNCLVILDGLEDLKRPNDLQASSRKEEVENSDVSGEEESGDRMTIAKLLKWKRSYDYADLHVWVSSREAECHNMLCPDDYVEVKMTGFSDEQFELYVKKCCQFYVRYKCPVQTEINEKCNEADTKVKQFLRENNIIKNFKTTPLLVNLIVHLLAAKYTSSVKQLDNTPIEDMNTLIRAVINCMEARYRHKKNKSEGYSFSNLEKKLGEIALQHNKQLTKKDRKFWNKNIGENGLDIALEIGLLKYSKDTSYAAQHRDVEFYHQRIQQYLADHVHIKYECFPEGSHI